MEKETIVGDAQPLTTSSVIRGVSLLAIAVVLFISCQQSTPPPLPTPVSYDWLHRHYEQEREANPTRLDKIVESRPTHVVRGTITSIQGAKVQFHVQRLTFGKDKYVECVFPDERNVWNFNNGETVLVVGRLDRADNVVRLQNCARVSERRFPEERQNIEVPVEPTS